jgi:hypothetical protein
MGDVGFGALAPDNDGGQEKADESADEKSDDEGNHISILFLDIFIQADLGEQKIDPRFYQMDPSTPASAMEAMALNQRKTDFTDFLQNIYQNYNILNVLLFFVKGSPFIFLKA